MGADGNIVLVGLDVTLKTLCQADDFDRMEREAPVNGGFLKRIGEFYLNFYREVAGKNGCGLHDSTALIACTHPHLFSKETIA
ncbi:MAG: nucleoside hydrolase, partial [Aestuariibacter sp.]|nr:nucleoside hydrolase [Aestuariibacter sp.]